MNSEMCVSCKQDLKMWLWTVFRKKKHKTQRSPTSVAVALFIFALPTHSHVYYHTHTSYTHPPSSMSPAAASTARPGHPALKCSLWIALSQQLSNHRPASLVRHCIIAIHYD